MSFLPVVFLFCIGVSFVYSLKSNTDNRVPVDFYVMSKCSDASYCESYYADSLSSISSIASVNLNYIATETSSGVFSCPHGETECEGNKMQLCVDYLYPNNIINPNTNRPLSYDFVLCQSESQSFIPANGQNCANILSLDWSLINNCYNNQTLSNSLFSASIKKSLSNNITTSCTIVVAGQEFCQHDGDWKNCPLGYTTKDFIDFICIEYGMRGGEGPVPKICQILKKKKH